MGNEGRTDPQTLPSNPLFVPGALVASKILAWLSASPVLQCTEITCSPMGPVCTPGCPLYLQQGWWDLKVVVKRRGLGCQRSLIPSCLTWRSTSSLHLMVKTCFWFHSWHPSETFPPPRSGVPALPPVAWCCQALLKSRPREPTQAAWQGFRIISSGLSHSLPL